MSVNGHGERGWEAIPEEGTRPGGWPVPALPSAAGDGRHWVAAEAALAVPLARLALLFGEFDARLRSAPQGVRWRLALTEAAELSWWAGDRIGVDRLALWMGLHVGATDDGAQALARAGWAVRRLAGGPFPAEGLAAFLGRSGTGGPDPQGGAGEGAIPPVAPGGAGAAPGLGDLPGLLADGGGLHPVTQAARLFHARRGLDPGRAMEAAVLAARHGATMARMPGQGAIFLPLAAAGASALRWGEAGQGPHAGAQTGLIGRWLAGWLAGAERATLAMLLQMERLEAWRQRAGLACADLSGRTPPRLLALLADWPMVSAPLAEAETGASRAAVQRGFDRLAARGLIREITGQARYRVWRAAL